MAATATEPNIQRQVRLDVQLSEDHLRRIQGAAAMSGQTLDSFIASELVRCSDEILKEEETRRLSNRDRDIFLALLESDPEPTQAAKDAAARFNQGRTNGDQYHFKA